MIINDFLIERLITTHKSYISADATSHEACASHRFIRIRLNRAVLIFPFENAVAYVHNTILFSSNYQSVIISTCNTAHNKVLC